jgi:hypothetical protein
LVIHNPLVVHNPGESFMAGLMRLGAHHVD